MRISYYKQHSDEWWALKKGRIGGTRFGQVISTRKNALIYELADEQLTDLDSFILEMESGFISDDMQAGSDNEPIARQMYIEQSGIQFDEIGFIFSDFSDIHGASPDGFNAELGIVLEVKYTRHGAKQIQRFAEGPETDKMAQIYNYFAVSDEVKQVHWVSYCPERMERPLVVKIFNKDQFTKEVTAGRIAIKAIEGQLIKLISTFKF